MKTKKEIEDKLDQMMDTNVEIMKMEAKQFHSGYSSALLWVLTNKKRGKVSYEKK